MTQNYFPRWKVKTEGTIAPDETLPLGQTLAMGIQHVVIMFGSTVLAPLIMGLDPNVAIFMSGIGTLFFFLIVGITCRRNDHADKSEAGAQVARNSAADN